MQIRRKNPFTGIERTRVVNVRREDYENYEKGYVSIAEACPYLNEDDRSFILAGMTDEEFRQAFSTEIKNIVNDRF